MPQVPDDPGRNETEEQRADRNLTDLLQELRVAGLGVQVLFGFLSSLPFTARFSDLDGQRRVLYVASLLLAALSTAVFLVVGVVDHGIVVPVIGALTVCAFAGLRFALPLAWRHSARANDTFKP